MPWTLESCAAFLPSRRRRAKLAQQVEPEEQVEQATASPGEKRELPKRDWSGDIAAVLAAAQRRIDAANKDNPRG